MHCAWLCPPTNFAASLFRRVYSVMPLARMLLRPGHRHPVGVAPVRLRRAELLQAVELFATARRRGAAIALSGGTCRFRRARTRVVEGTRLSVRDALRGGRLIHT